MKTKAAIPAATLALLTLLGAASLPAAQAVSAHRRHHASAPTRSWPVVRRGDEDGPNGNITLIQYLLRAKGFPVVVDGTFGLQTEQQVRRFQQASGLPSTGRVAGSTWRALIVPLHLGSRGDAVRAAQDFLKEVSASPVPQDGFYGPRTERAVRAFQRDSGLPVTGAVGPSTWLQMTEDIYD